MGLRLWCINGSRLSSLEMETSVVESVTVAIIIHGGGIDDEMRRGQEPPIEAIQERSPN